MSRRNRRLLSIGPWSLDSDSAVKRQILSDECGQNGWELICPTNIADDNDREIKEWLTTIADATLVLVDLSLERPSCYYELGCVETMKKTVAVIGRLGTPIHQTFRRDTVIFYDGLVDYRRVVHCLVCS